ncbi:MAG: DUF2892 domain-containing protein [Thioalkalispiraceae bacterium]
MFRFKRNMGTLDRSIRVLVGISMLLIGPTFNFFELPTILVIICGVLGTLAIVSAVFAYCFLYELTDSNTLR